MELNPGRVQEVFLAAIEQEEAADRAAVLDRECAYDDELRRRVESLLIAHDKPARVLDRPLVAPGNRAPKLGVESVEEVDPRPSDMGPIA